MTCEACGREHAISGTVLVEGLVVPPAWIETLAEILCRHGKLAPEPDDGPDLGPPVLKGEQNTPTALGDLAAVGVLRHITYLMAEGSAAQYRSVSSRR